MKARLLTREVLPHLLAFVLLVAAALGVDALLHFLGAARVGRYLGIPGVLLIVGSFGYSLAKRKLIRVEKPTTLLSVHERMAWAGSLLLLVHAGVHFNAILGWLAVVAMLVNIGSGLTGKYLLEHSRRRLMEARKAMHAQGMTGVELENHLYWDAFTFDVVAQWRVVHFPITLAFTLLGVGHIVSVLMFWGWK